MRDLFRVFFILIAIALLTAVHPSSLLAASPQEQLAGKSVTIVTTYKAVSGDKKDGTSPWPAIAVYSNNFNTYDGPMDYGDCLPGNQSNPNSRCGTPPNYSERMIDSYTVEGASIVKRTVITADKLFTFLPMGNNKYYDIAKLSYVFHNDYWNPSTGADRNLSIVKIEFLGPDGNVFKDYTPSQYDSYYGNITGGAKQSLYFDMGIVQIDDLSTGTGVQKAFDKQELKTIADNNSVQSGEWALGQEGSFNLVSEDLYDLFASKYLNTSDTAQLSCGMDVKLTCLDTGTAQLEYTFTKEPNFDYSTAQVRMNAYPNKNDECTNSAGQKVGWYCGLSEGIGLDQFHGLSKGTVSKTIAVTPNVTYAIRASIDTTKSNIKLNDTSDVSKMKCSSAVKEVTCTKTRKGPEDVNADSIVNTKDHDMLVAVFNTSESGDYLSADVDSDGYVSIFDYNRVLAAIGNN